MARSWQACTASGVASVFFGLVLACGGGGGSSSPPPLDFFVDSAYITQGTQTYTGTIPLIADRDGYLRIFVRANLANTAMAVVRVTLQDGTTINVDAPAGLTSVPTTISEGDLTKSWNLALAGSSITSGFSATILVDPSNTYQEADRANNARVITPTVNTAKVFSTTLIPVVQSGLTGNVDTDRALTDWLDRFQRMYPIRNLPGGVDIQKRAAYSTTADLETGKSPAASQDGWAKLLGEIEALRVVEASDRYYFGVANVSYGSGIAGLGYRPTDSTKATFRSAIGWDKTGYEDGGNYPEVFAHEVGHNLGRLHAPCGKPASVDLSYPYPDGSIGTWGWDRANPSVLRNPSTHKDIMSYCAPVWVSDYTYKSIMVFRATSPMGDIVSAQVMRQECLLVAGRILDGQVILNPAFVITTVPQMPQPGAYILQLQDGQGTTLLEVPFDPTEVADLPDSSEQHFVFAIPLETNLKSVLSGLSVIEGGVVRASRLASPMAAKVVGGREPVSVRMRPGQAHLSWDPLVHPRVMVRDPRTGEVLSFAEGGSVDVVTDASELDVTFSDGVVSTRKILKVQ